MITIDTLRDATGWDALVTELGQPGVLRHGLRHTPWWDPSACQGARLAATLVHEGGR
jgi:hypothetical protein